MPFPDPADAVTVLEIPPKPGLGEKDRAILEAMLENGFIRPERMWFNLPVGNLDRTLQAQLPENLRDWYERTYSKRPDVIYEQGGALFAAEVKPYASYNALGQALLYQFHASLKTDPARPVQPIILTDLPDPDLVPVAAIHAVEIVQLGFFIEGRPSFPT